MWKSKHYVDCSSGLLCVVGSSAPPPYSPNMSPCHEIKRTVRGHRFPTLNGVNLAMTRRIWKLNSNGLLDGVKKLPNHWKCLSKPGRTTLNDTMWKLTQMNKFDWFLVVCALLLKWTSYSCRKSLLEVRSSFPVKI